MYVPSVKFNSLYSPNQHDHNNFYYACWLSCIIGLLGLVGNGILLPKLFWPTVRKNCSSDREKLLKFEAESREFSKFLKNSRPSALNFKSFSRSLEQFFLTVGQNNFGNKIPYLIFCREICGDFQPLGNWSMSLKAVRPELDLFKLICVQIRLK